MGNLSHFDLARWPQCKHFVETGYGNGAGLDYALTFPHFESLTEIEIDSAKIRRDHQENPRVAIIGGDSGETLEVGTCGITSPILFWLDAHYAPGFDGGEGRPIDYPLVRELAGILAHRPGHDVILIDDLNIYEAHRGDHVPNPERAAEFAALLERFAITHSATRDIVDEGYLALEPLAPKLAVLSAMGRMLDG